jgi:glutathione-regulated potassium-efflux system ancillary protein KefF
VACPVPETDRPAESDDIGKVLSGAYQSAMARGLASMSAANEEEKNDNNKEGTA